MNDEDYLSGILLNTLELKTFPSPKKMNQPELTKKLAVEMKLPVKTALSIIKTIRDTMTEALVKGENIEIRGFGTFKIKRRDSYIFSNPRTGEKMEIKPRKTPLFTVGLELKSAVDDGGGKK